MAAKPRLPRESLWAIEATTFKSVRQAVVRAEFSDLLPPSKQRDFEVYDDVAVIDVSGILEKHQSVIGWLFDGTSMVEVQRQVEEAADDSSIRRIVLRVDSPGGTVSGSDELSQTIFEAADTKEVIVYASDTMASAAYWIAVGASAIYCNRSASVGSIGTFIAVTDWSRALKAAGVSVEVFTTGKYKAAGYEGTSLTPDQRDHIQATVDRINSVFLRAVRDGRGLSRDQMAKVSTAAIFIGSDAVTAGLVDGICRFEDLLDSSYLPRSGSGSSSRSSEKRSSVSKSRSKGPQISRSSATSRDPISEWKALVAKFVAKGMTPIEATMKAHEENPKLAEAARKYANSPHRRRRR